MANNDDGKNSDYVVFNNGKMFAGKRKPHSCSSYRDKYGTLIRFKDIPLNDLQGKPHMRPAKAGEQPTVVTWGQDMDFSKTNSYRLHKKIHEHVIEAFQNHPGTVTSKHPERNNGIVIQYEPWLEQAAREKSADATLTVFAKSYELLEQEDQSPCDLVFAHLGLSWKNKSEKKQLLVDLVKNAAGQKMFLDCLATGKKVDIKEELRYPAMVLLAKEKGIIAAGNDFIWRMKGSTESLGSNIATIHTDDNKMAGIISALSQAGYVSKESIKKKKKNTK